MHRHSPDSRTRKTVGRDSTTEAIVSTRRTRRESRARSLARGRNGVLLGITVVAVATASWAVVHQSRVTTELATVTRPATGTPDAGGTTNTAGYEVGRRFVLTADATISGLTFSASVPTSDQITVDLWSTNGAQLATGHASIAPSVRGRGHHRHRHQYQFTATFNKSVTLTKGTQFTASFWAPHLRQPEPTPVSGNTPQGPATAGSLVYRKGAGFPDVAGPVGTYPIALIFSKTTGPTPTPSVSPTPTTQTSTPPISVGGGNGSGSATKNCAPRPSACGFPDSTNTGAGHAIVAAMKAGESSSGRGWHYDSRGWLEIDGAGAVVENLTLTHGIDVTADNVTIRNVRIMVGGEGFGIGVRSANNVTIEDSTIYGPGAGSSRLMVAIKDIFSDSTGLKILRNNIYNTSTAIQIDAGLVQDNYIHDLGYKAGDHLNGTTSNATSGLLTLRHNTVLNSFSQTDAISLFEDFGVQMNRVIDDNLLAGGGYTLYAGANSGGKATSNIKVTNNRFSKMYYPGGGYFGSVTAFDPKGAGNVWSGNVWDDTGAELRP